MHVDLRFLDVTFNMEMIDNIDLITGWNILK